MRVAFFSMHSYDNRVFQRVASELNVDKDHTFVFYSSRLTMDTTVLTKGFGAVVMFVNDCATRAILQELHQNGVQLLLLRCAGFDMVDLQAAKELGLKVARVPEYSPHAVAEFAIAIMMTLNRKIHTAYNRTRELNFRLTGLMGFDVYGKTIGVIGTGRIGMAFTQICLGFGAKVLAYDLYKNPQVQELGVEYLDTLEELLPNCDVISLHCPLLESTRHLINKRAVELMKPGVMLINTSRGGLIETAAVVQGLKSRKIGALGLDVFEGESEYFYNDFSDGFIADDSMARLFTFPNVLITGHQAFFTKEAMDNIASTTLENLCDFVASKPLKNEVVAK